MDYPRMIYHDGEVGEDWRIVTSAEEEQAAAADGYLSHDNPMTADDDAPKRRGRPPKEPT